MSLVASDFGTGQVFLSMLWFFLFFIWIWLLIAVFSDIFRSHDLSGGLKAIWTIFVVIMPYLGVFIYLLARGGKMHEHAAQAAQQQDAATRAYIQSAVTTGSSATDQLAQLSNLKAQGVIDDAEFQKMKAKVVG
jgi:Short C-terminal domain/Phospholipase_D-nuclease N-terminal